MKIRLFSFLAVSFLISFSACQKEVDGVLGNSPDTDSTTIRKYIEFDTTLASGLDTISVVKFGYDDSKRLISLEIADKDLSLPPSILLTFHKNSVYSYKTNNDRLPFKIISSNKDAFGDTHDTAFLFYINGIVSKDSIRTRTVDPSGFTVESIEVNNYVVSGNTTTVTQYRDQTLNPTIWPPACPGTTTYQNTVVNGNIISGNGTYSSCSGIGMSESNFSYDNKPNPFYPLRIPYPILDGYLDFAVIQRNNILENWFSLPSDGYKYSYTYRFDGYPLIVRGYEVSDPTNAWKGLYIYK